MNQKNKPLIINVSRFINSNKPLTTKQLYSIQQQIVSNMVVMNRSAESIYDFVKESNKIKRHLNSNSVSTVGRKRILDLLNVGEVEKRDGKHYLKISKPKITKFSKMGGSFDKKILKKLEKNGLVKKSINNLIKQRANPNKKIKITIDSSLKRTLEILDSFSNPEKYFADIQRICFDYHGLWFETYEDYVNWRTSLR